jgi:hypothetical protein
MQDRRKSLLVRADFVLGKGQALDRRTYKRWRRILRDALPGLLGCERRCPKAEKVRLRGVHAQGEAIFSGWVRIPILRRPGRKRLRMLKERLRRRLEANLLLIAGQVVKLGVRRCRGAAVAQGPVPQPVAEEGRVEIGPTSPPLPLVTRDAATDQPRAEQPVANQAEGAASSPPPGQAA